jgi:protease I
MHDVQNRRILMIATDGFEQSELMQPMLKLREAGAHVDIASPDGGTIRGWRDGDWGETIPVDLSFDQIDTSSYDGLIIPGGQINPDKLRLDDRAVTIVEEFVDGGQMVAAICHGPWLLVEADVVDGVKLTSWRSLRTDLENAGAEWVDQDVVVDEGIVTSRSPADLDAFIGKIMEELSEGRHAREQAA